MKKNLNLLNWFQKTDLLSDTQKLALYPPFLFMGAHITSLTPDYRELKVKLPLRWYARNHYGTMFGGFMSSLADPLPALLCHKIFPDTEVWTKRLNLHFLRPGRTDLELRIEISQEQIDEMARELSETGKSRPKFRFYYFDAHEHKVAVVENTVAIRKLKPGA